MVAEQEQSAYAVDEEVAVDNGKQKSIFMRLYTNAWFQVYLISVICFCCPGVSIPNP